MNIYVGNMSFDLTEADLRAAFEAFGAVGPTQRVRLRRDALNIRSASRDHRPQWERVHGAGIERQRGASSDRR
jgi:hypothetical protein